jgi:hypothetical protein
VQAVTATPAKLNVLACTPPNPPERPEVTAKVTDPDDGPSGIIVELHYGVGGTAAYNGVVQMTYDAQRGVFRYLLPEVTKAKVGADARSIGLSVTARNPSAENVTRPTSAWILFAGYCMNG